MANSFKIKLPNGQIVEQEPVVGKWYCAVNTIGTIEPYEDLGALGEYVGDGEFEGDLVNVTFAMCDCNYLIEQC